MQTRADTLGKWIQSQGENRLPLTYARLFQRPPTDRELQAAHRFLTGRESDSAAWSQYAQALLAANEVMFVD